MRIIVLPVGVFACRACMLLFHEQLERFDDLIIIITYSFCPAALEIHGRSKWLIVIQLNCSFTKILCSESFDLYHGLH